MALLLASALAPALMPLLPQDNFQPGISKAFARQNVAIEKVEIPFAFGTITLNQVAVTGSSLPASEIEAILRAKSMTGLADRLEKLDADKLTIRSIVMNTKVEGSDSVTTYEGFEAKSIKRGIIGQVSVASARQEGVNKAGDKEVKLSSTFGRMSIEALDLGGNFRWLTEADPTGKAPMKRLYGRYLIDGMKMTIGDQANISIGKMDFAYFDAKLPKRAMLNEILALSAAQGQQDKDPNAGARFLATMIAVSTSYRFGPGSVGATEMDINGPNGKVSGKIGAMAFDGGDKAFGKLSGIEFKAADGHFKIREIGSSGDMFSAMFMAGANALLLADATAGARTGRPDKKPLTPETRALLEESVKDGAALIKGKDVGFNLAGIDVDVPPGKNAKSQDRVKFTIAGFDTTVGGFIANTPTKIILSLKNFLMPLPANSTEKAVVSLKEFGLDRLGFSANIALNYADAGSKLSIPDISIDVDKLARVGLKGELGGVPRAFFDAPSKNWPMLLGSGAVQRVDLAIANRGGLDKVFAKAAGDQGKQPDQFRMEISAMAPMMIGAVLGGHPDAAKLSQAVGTFLGSLNALDIALISASPNGIPVTEIISAARNPSMVLPKIRFEASAK